MNRHEIDDKLLDDIHAAIERGEIWMAYNAFPYFLQKGDMEFFHSKQEAKDFAVDNYSDSDHFVVLQARSITEVYQHMRYETDSITQNQNKMNEKNFEYLTKQLKYTGFEESLNAALKEQLQAGSPGFTLSHNNAYGNDQTVATLQFQKSSTTDMYFFNRYELALKHDRLAEPLKQTFYINTKGDNVTLKEGYNLLCGRAVHKDFTTKEGQEYRAWIQLDFKQSEANGNFKVKQIHEAYGFDLEKTLAKYPVKELQTEKEKTALLESLQRGNRQAATLLTDVGSKRVFLEASPQYKSLNVYEIGGQRMRITTAPPKEEQAASLKQEGQKTSVKQNVKKEETGEGIKSKRSKKAKQSL